MYPTPHSITPPILIKIIKNLNVNERVILTLKYVYDQKNEEIASTLKLNINTIKSITKRALDKLK